MSNWQNGLRTGTLKVAKHLRASKCGKVHMPSRTPQCLFRQSADPLRVKEMAPRMTSRWHQIAGEAKREDCGEALVKTVPLKKVGYGLAIYFGRYINP